MNWSTWWLGLLASGSQNVTTSAGRRVCVVGTATILVCVKYWVGNPPSGWSKGWPGPLSGSQLRFFLSLLCPQWFPRRRTDEGGFERSRRELLSMAAESYVLNHPAVFPGSPRLSISRNLIANLVASQTWAETRSPTTHFTAAVLQSTEYFRLILKLRDARGDRLQNL